MTVLASRRARALLPLATLAALACAVAWVEACGPDWVQLLPARQRELREPIPMVLADELRALALPSPLDAAARQALAADAPGQVGDPYETAEDRAARSLKAQQQGLSAGDARAYASAREAASGDAAEAAAQRLPPAWRLYAAAAADVRRGEAQPARQRFERLLALPADQARPLAVWAAFSLGRILSDSDPAASAQAFAQARRWRSQGAPDPLGLALDSLGEEARLRVPLDEEDRTDFAQADAATFVAALRLYLEQARLGSRSGVESLRLLKDELLRPERLAPVLAADWGQALLVRLLADQGFWVEAPDAQRRYRQVVAALDAQPDLRLAEPERWAALAWQQGDLARARRWVGEQPTTALGAWTRAKLALADGDAAASARWFAAAVQAWPRDAAGPTLARLRAEQGLLQLQRGELPLALRTWMAAGDTYAMDTAFVAERLLTSAELRAVVDDLAPATATAGPPRLLRHLLARRLMREGRFAEAVAYFPTRYEVERWLPDGSRRSEVLDLSALARQYADTLGRAERAWTRAGRAATLMEAGHLARQHGMELMGFELGADAFAFDGAFDLRDAEPIDAARGRTEAERLRQAQPTLPLPAEVAAGPLPRFHYRYVAAEHALQAAAQLPPRSQAFASTVCHAALWVGPRDDAFMRAMWGRYVRQGAVVPWASRFGQDCPEPELMGARWMQARAGLREAVPVLHRHPYRSAAGASLVLAAGVAGAWAWRRRRLAVQAA